MLRLTEPTFLLDKEKCLTNITFMVEKARRFNIILRPHFKTHQSHEVGRWFRDKGVDRITVSSLKMAEYFAADGWTDITVAIPVNIREHERINRLAEKITLNLLVASADVVDELARVVHHNQNLFIEIDTGYHRTGVAPDEVDEIISRIQQHPQFDFKGFLVHAGHSYKVRNNKVELLKILQEGTSILKSLKQQYISRFPNIINSWGDTPTCSIGESFEGIDEIRPGNFVFYDVMQHAIGSCSLENIGVAMACPVIAAYPERNEIVIHGGAVHFSKDLLTMDGHSTYGKVVNLTNSGWSTAETGMYIKSLSQEHGIIHAENFYNIKAGDWLGVLPIHSCLTADAMKEYLSLQGQIITMMGSTF